MMQSPGLDPIVHAILIFVLASVCVYTTAVALFGTGRSSNKTYGERFALIAATDDARAKNTHQPSANGGRRKRSIEATLKEVEEKHKATIAQKAGKPSLAARMRQADLAWSKATYVLISLGIGASAFGIGALFGLAWYTALGFAVAGGLLIPHAFVGFKRHRRLKSFAQLFPSAVDVVVRGVKSGLPLPDCLRIIATEIAEPVRGEFKQVVDDQTIGMPIDEALKRLAERIPLSETNFFAIVVGVQSKTGGSLAEGLGNLSKVLRERKKMESKIQSMSQEAKTSGGIIGALPIIVGLLVFLSSPDFISVMVTETIGNIVLAGCAVWMAIGIFVMKKMINFDF